MRERKISSGTLDEQGAGDLFAFFYSARLFERPGDAARGKQVLEQNCARCHGTSSTAGPPPVSRWQSVHTPFELTEAMWNHLPYMSAVAAASRTTVPQLSAQNLVDLLVYVR